MTERGHVVVLGGTGHYGREIVRDLRRRGVAVRVLTRNAASARAMLGDDVDCIEGDIRRREAITTVLYGARALIIGVTARDRTQIRSRLKIERDAVLAVLQLAERNGVERVVYLSGYDVRRELAERLGVLDFARPMLDVQDALARSRLDWTVLGCAPSMRIFFAMIRGKTMTVPGGGPAALPTISPLDAGTVAAQTTLRRDLAGQRIRMPGPEAISFPEAARRISAVWGRPIRFRRIPLTPIRVAAAVAGPVFPFVAFVGAAVRLLNAFPESVAAEVPADHAKLRDLFDFEPHTLEDEARRRRPSVRRTPLTPAGSG